MSQRLGDTVGDGLMTCTTDSFLSTMWKLWITTHVYKGLPGFKNDPLSIQATDELVTQEAGSR